MRLTIRKRQAEKKGMFGGSKGMLFTLYAQAVLSPDEQSLVETYKAGDTNLASYTIPSKKKDFPDILFTVNAQNLMAGYQSEEVGDVATLLELERNIISACATFKQLLSVMETFDGEAKYDFIQTEDGRIVPEPVA